MSKNALIAVAVIIVLAVAGWYVLKPQKMSAPQPPQEVTAIPTPSPAASPAPIIEEGMMEEEKKMEKNTIIINSSGFAPKNVTVKVGESVTWMNNDSENHTVNSSPHPTHTDNPFLNVGLIRPDEKKSLTFDKAGTYKYHDHLNPSLFGSVTVE